MLCTLLTFMLLVTFTVTLRYCVLVSRHCVIVMLWLLRRCVSKFILVLLM